MPAHCALSSSSQYATYSARQTANQRDQIPIVFITAFTDESTRVQALEAGAIGYLIKPFEEADLLGYIHRALHQRETAPRPRPPPQ
jgi:DNA-binding response OmpR family regulator